MLGRNPFYSNAKFYSIINAKNFMRNALVKINYRMKWSTTVYPRPMLVRKSRIPFGAFLVVAVKFTD
jgi:hypothetical protein